ncbi:MAG: helix-turn-helix domain-containing protein [Treponema sp.]|jgi:transcriptional regulator with XRE-family HTH domain|nr:helix-turn-helix domain-containing protein [Treponema sp.]
MTSLRSVLAFNMKVQRQILGISQTELAERVNTSTNYIALIKTEKGLPKPEMLERIAVALEIQPPALFATEIRPLAEMLAKVHKGLAPSSPRGFGLRLFANLLFGDLAGRRRYQETLGVSHHPQAPE